MEERLTGGRGHASRRDETRRLHPAESSFTTGQQQPLTTTAQHHTPQAPPHPPLTTERGQLAHPDPTAPLPTLHSTQLHLTLHSSILQLTHTRRRPRSALDAVPHPPSTHPSTRTPRPPVGGTKLLCRRSLALAPPTSPRPPTHLKLRNRSSTTTPRVFQLHTNVSVPTSCTTAAFPLPTSGSHSPACNLSRSPAESISKGCQEGREHLLTAPLPVAHRGRQSSLPRPSRPLQHGLARALTTSSDPRCQPPSVGQGATTGPGDTCIT